MIFLLDTNVLSELWKPAPMPAVLAWCQQAEWLIPVPVIAEIQAGADLDPSPTRRRKINGKLDEFIGFDAVLDWDAETARVWGRLKHSPEVKRQPQALWDSLIDALAVRYAYTVATRNAADFRHAETFNPFSEDPAGE